MTTTERGRQGGYVMVTVVMLAVLMVAGVVGYARYALLTEEHTVATLTTHGSRQAIMSGLQYARQALAHGTLATSATLTVGDRTVDVDLVALPSGLHGVTAVSTRHGLGASIRAQLQAVPSEAGALPTLDPALAEAVLDDPATRVLTHGESLVDQTIDGTLVVAAGASVHLADLIVRGSIVSAPALDGPPYDSLDATAVYVGGTLRVDGVGPLQGVAVLLPDGSFTSHDDSQLELHGAVVTDQLDLQGGGAVHGPILGMAVLALDPRIDQPGAGRTPQPWTDALQAASHEIAWIAFPPAGVSVAEKQAVAGFDFPSSAAGPGNHAPTGDAGGSEDP